jgi:hypothetical protein
MILLPKEKTKNEIRLHSFLSHVKMRDISVSTIEDIVKEIFWIKLEEKIR